MKYTFACIEQLDLAAVQLHQPHHSYRRFSLIMTDNIVEVMAYVRCKGELEGYFEYAFSDYSEMFSESEKVKVLGNDFSTKIKFLVKRGRIIESEQNFILRAHPYRNAVYHQGLVREDVLYPIAWHYHDLACDLFAKLEPPYYTRASNATYSDVALKHFGVKASDIGRVILDEDRRNSIAASLKSLKPQPPPDLGNTLSSSILIRLASLKDNLEMAIGSFGFASDNPKIRFRVEIAKLFLRPEEWSFGKTVGEVLENIQSERFFFRDENAGIHRGKPKHPVREQTIERWKRSASDLRKETDLATALQKYESIDRDMSYIEAIALEAADRIGESIDRAYDEFKYSSIDDQHEDPS